VATGHEYPRFLQRRDRRRRQDDQIGHFARHQPVAQRADGVEVQIELAAGVPLELGAERRHHRLHGAGAQDFDGGHVNLAVAAGW